ncbi:hypothetical protein BGX29_004288 [Mortierella sp. GBA35]|nr:hypothetical protein BGX29_004288 [Mortierella sp. GBA35]
MSNQQELRIVENTNDMSAEMMEAFKQLTGLRVFDHWCISPVTQLKVEARLPRWSQDMILQRLSALANFKFGVTNTDSGHGQALAHELTTRCTSLSTLQMLQELPATVMDIHLRAGQVERPLKKALMDRASTLQHLVFDSIETARITRRLRILLRITQSDRWD